MSGLLIWRTRLGYEIRTYGFSPKAARYAGISETRIIVVTMMISGALAGMMALNPIMGDQHNVSLDFVSGAGFVGIAVALMGRSHPAGIVPAAILFGMLYQGGAELAFEMPAISRDMIVIIQGLVILFAGALEHLFRPAVQTMLASSVPVRSVWPQKGSAPEMEFFDALINILNSTIRVSVPLLLACLAGLYSERSGVFDIGLEGKMLAGAFAGAAAAAVFQSAWIGLGIGMLISVMLSPGPWLCLDHPSRQPDRLGRGHQLHRRGLDHHSRPGLVQPGRPHAVAAARGALRRRSTLPGADALRDVPVIGPALFRAALGPLSLLAYLAFLAVPFTWWVLFRTRFGLRLRAVGENPAAVDTAGISVAWLRYRAVICTGILTGIAGCYMSLSQNAGFVKDMTAGRGYIALAALIFAKWKPVPAMFACLLFGFLDALSIRLQGTPLPLIGKVPVQLMQALPYILTVILLAGFIGKAIPPRAGGVPYVKER